MVSLHTRNQTWKPKIGGKCVSIYIYICFSDVQKGGEYFPGFHVGVMPEIRNVMIKVIVMFFKQWLELMVG